MGKYIAILNYSLTLGLKMKIYAFSVIFLCLLVCPVFASIGVQNMAIKPSGDLISGQTKLTSSFIVDFVPSGGTTFPSENTLQFTSELDNPKWSFVLVQDGIENPRPVVIGPNVNINGWELSYPSSHKLSMRVNFEGTAPVVTQSEQKILIRVRELNHQGVIVPGTEIVKTAMVLNSAEIQGVTSNTAADLQSLRKILDDLRTQGIDVSAAEIKYNQASIALQNAEKTSDYSTAQTYVNNAKTLISEGNVLVRQAHCLAAIDTANIPIEQTDALITYFKVNRNMESDPRLDPIITKREIAAGIMVGARDYISQGNYDMAIKRANEAIAKGQEALSDAQRLKAEIDGGYRAPTTSATYYQSFTSSTPADNDQKEILNELKKQSELLEEQNKKMDQNNNLLQNILDKITTFFDQIFL